MAKLVVKKLGGSKLSIQDTGVSQKRVRDKNSGRLTTLRTIDAASETLTRDLEYVFSRNVAKARRDNKAVTGQADGVLVDG